MARNREILVLVLDVGPSMHSILPEVEKVCSMLVEKKLIYNKYDEVGIVLFGTEDTKNELTEEVGGYQHVVVLQNMKVVDGDLVDVLKRIPRGTVSGDFLDAIIVGMDMLIKKFGETEKGKKRLCLVTDALFPIKEPYEGTKEDQVMTIAQQMTKHGMRMDSVVVRGRFGQDANENIMDENDILLNIFSEKTNAKMVYVESPTSLLGAIRTRSIAPVTIFRGDLEISTLIKIKVWVYKKTSEEKFPTLKRYSDKAPPTDKFATHEVKVDYEYKSVEEPSKVVPPEHRIKGYRYGPQVVPISTAEWDAVKFKPEKSVKLLGFTNATNIMRHYYMKDVNVVIAEPSNKRAIVAVSALARAMKEMDKVAIVRCVWRQGQGTVVVGVLTPNISKKDGIADSLYFNVLPFAEDVREFQFPSFSNLPALMQPSDEQQQAADELVKMLDLAPAGREEILPLDFTPNPVLEITRLLLLMGFIACFALELCVFIRLVWQRFYRHLELKSKDPDAAVPPLDGTLQKITEPDPDLFSQNKSVIDTFHKRFELKENPKLKKPRRHYLREKAFGSSDKEDNEEISAQIVDSVANMPIVKVEKIGDSTPLQDFEAMMSRRDSPEWISKAISGMINKIFDLVENPSSRDNHLKAIEYLLALRKGCIIEQELKQFNDFLRHLCKFCSERNLHSLFEFLASQQISLISKEEAADSEVADDEARSFWVKMEPTSEPKLEQV